MRDSRLDSSSKTKDLLIRSGWQVADITGSAIYDKIVIKSLLISGSQYADLGILINGKVVGIIEIKAFPLERALEQAERYANQYSNNSIQPIKNPIPFVYATDGEKILFKNLLDDLSANEPIEKFHSPEELQNLLQLKLQNNEKTIINEEINYWWVCQGYSYEKESAEGVLRAPDDNIHHHKHLKELKPGDIVINYANSKIRAISKVLSPYRIDNNQEIIVDVNYKRLDSPISREFVKEIQQKNVNLFNFIYGPIDVNGNINQGYLFKFNKQCYDLVFTNEQTTLKSDLANENKENKNISAGKLGTTYVHPDKAAEIDLLGRDIYSEGFARLIVSPEVSTPLVSSIFGEWGSGKSSFIQHIIEKVRKIEKNKKLSLKDKFIKIIKREKINSTIRTHFVEFNAWKYDDQDKIWAGMLQSIIKEYNKSHWVKFKYFIKALFNPPWVILAIIFVCYFLIVILPGLNIAEDAKIWIFNIPSKTFGIVKIFFGTSLVIYTIIKFVEIYNKNLKGFYNYFKLPDYSEHLGFRDEIEKDLDTILNNWLGQIKEGSQEREKGRLVLFIDDLDRCAVNKVLQVIDCIQIFLSKKGIISFIAIDHSFMDKKINKRSNKIKMDYNYFEKIIQIPFLLPDTSEPGKYLEKLLNITNSEPQFEKKSNISKKNGNISETTREEGQHGESSHTTTTTKTEGTQINNDVDSNEEFLLRVADKVAIRDLSKYLPKNPRKIKRFINTYILSRYFLCNSDECKNYNPMLLSTWLLVCCKHHKLAQEIREYVLNSKDITDIFKPNICEAYKNLDTHDIGLISKLLNSQEYSLDKTYIKITDCFLLG